MSHTLPADAPGVDTDVAGVLFGAAARTGGLLAATAAGTSGSSTARAPNERTYRRNKRQSSVECMESDWSGYRQWTPWGAGALDDRTGAAGFLIAAPLEGATRDADGAPAFVSRPRRRHHAPQRLSTRAREHTVQHTGTAKNDDAPNLSRLHDEQPDHNQQSLSGSFCRRTISSTASVTRQTTRSQHKVVSDFSSARAGYCCQRKATARSMTAPTRTYINSSKATVRPLRVPTRTYINSRKAIGH